MNSDEEEDWPHDVHRDHDMDDAGTSQVVLQRFMKKQLPLLLKMKEEVDAGKDLSDGEMELLDRMLHRADKLNRFVYEHPEYRDLVGKIISLIDDITDEAVDNETEAQQKKE